MSILTNKFFINYFLIIIDLYLINLEFLLLFSLENLFSQFL